MVTKPRKNNLTSLKKTAQMQTLTLKAWVSDEYREVEHICPQSEEKTPTNGWEKGLEG